MEEASLSLSIFLPLEMAEDVAWDLTELGATAVEQRDPSTLCPAQSASAELLAGFADEKTREAAVEVLAAQLGDRVKMELKRVDDDSWQTKWREFFEPVVLSHLQVITPWMDAPRQDRETIVLDPGQAFGTGGHATTRLILTMLESRAAERKIDRVLDVGTGSGILAIGAIKLGAELVVAIDIDPEAVLQTRKNAIANGVDGIIMAEVNGPREVGGEWPLVLANLDIAAFQNCAEHVSARVAPDGEALLSGLLVEQVEACLQLWPGFEVTGQLEEDGWAAVALRRPR